MDPNANLREQKALIDENINLPMSNWSEDDISRLFDLRQELYDWIRDGGFAPDWTICPLAAAYYGK